MTANRDVLQKVFSDALGPLEAQTLASALRSGEVIGVTQALNKRSGDFTELDRVLLEAINHHAASALEQAHLVERLEQSRREESELLAITEALSSELQLDTLLDRIIRSTTQ